MTKPGYTHVLIPKSLHSILKDKAEKAKTSIWEYIQMLEEKNTERSIMRGSGPCDVGSNPIRATFILRRIPGKKSQWEDVILD